MKKIKPSHADREQAKLLAIIIRNAMEDFHAEYLSDSQMKELNPIIRNACVTFFYMMSNLKDEKVQKVIRYNLMCIPNYWEEPQLMRDFVKFLNSDYGTI